MATLGMIAVLLFLIIMGFSAVMLQQIATKRALNQWSRTYGVEVIGYEIMKRPQASSGVGHTRFEVGKIKLTYRRKNEREFEECTVNWFPGLFGSKIDPPPPRSFRNRLETRSRSGAPDYALSSDGVGEPRAFAAPPPAAIPVTFDERVRAEVARRLDTLTAQPGWAQSYDLDGSGHIDSEEWETLRQNIEREVRDELALAVEDGAGGDGTPPPTSDTWQGGGW